MFKEKLESILKEKELEKNEENLNSVLITTTSNGSYLEHISKRLEFIKFI